MSHRILSDVYIISQCDIWLQIPEYNITTLTHYKVIIRIESQNLFFLISESVPNNL